jgi:hypothetical protein
MCSGARQRQPYFLAAIGRDRKFEMPPGVLAAGAPPQRHPLDHATPRRHLPDEPRTRRVTGNFAALCPSLRLRRDLRPFGSGMTAL